MNPDRWLIIKTSHCHKLFATWSGGYTQADNWCLNSGIVSVERDGEYYIFHGHSGSTYRCHKDSYGSTIIGYGVLENWKQLTTDIEVVEDCDDWSVYGFT